MVWSIGKAGNRDLTPPRMKIHRGVVVKHKFLVVINRLNSQFGSLAILLSWILLSVVYSNAVVVDMTLERKGQIGGLCFRCSQFFDFKIL